MRLVDPLLLAGFPRITSLSGSLRTLYALCKYSTLLRQSVLLFMRTIFDSLIINHLFAHSLCSSPFFGDPAIAQPSVAEHFTLVVGQPSVSKSCFRLYI